MIVEKKPDSGAMLIRSEPLLMPIACQRILLPGSFPKPLQRTADYKTVNSQTYAVQRKHERLPLPIPIVVTGIGKDGSRFSEPTQTVNVGLKGMGLLLKHEVHPNSRLNILVCHRQNLFRLTAEVCHVTKREGNTIVGVKFREPIEFCTS
jgi:PilZ domain-containing protein